MAAGGPGGGARARMDDIARRVRTCTLCALHVGRTHAVPGEGAGCAGGPDATLDIEVPFSGVFCVGEAPGRNEDATGRPFCGAAGRRLNEAFGAAGLRREEVFVTSIVKCRPPDNRDPRPEEKEACLPYLQEQVAALRPRVLVALGRHGLSALVDDPPQRFTDVRGRFLTGRLGVPVWVSLHPAAIIYRQAWRQQYLEDWQAFGAWLREDGDRAEAAPASQAPPGRGAPVGPRR